MSPSGTVQAEPEMSKVGQLIHLFNIKLAKTSYFHRSVLVEVVGTKLEMRIAGKSPEEVVTSLRMRQLPVDVASRTFWEMSATTRTLLP